MTTPTDPRAAAEEALRIVGDQPFWSLRSGDLTDLAKLAPILARAVIEGQTERDGMRAEIDADGRPNITKCGACLADRQPEIIARNRAQAPLTEEPRLVWRGSVSDFATDIRGVMSAEQIVRLVNDLRPTAPAQAAAPLTEEEARRKCESCWPDGWRNLGTFIRDQIVGVVVAASRGAIPPEARANITGKEE